MNAKGGVRGQIVRGLGRLVCCMAFLAVIGLASADEAAQPDAAGAFLGDLRDRAIEQLTAPDTNPQERERRFRKLLHESFDLEAIGRFMLASYWGNAGPDEQRAFLDAFEDHMVQRFLPLFAQYRGQTLVVEDARSGSKGDDFVLVESRIEWPEGAATPVQWRMRKETDGYRIVDVMTEGVSMAITLRSEYGSVLRANGGDVGALAEALRGKSAQTKGDTRSKP